MKNNKKGFTLVEIMIVVVIIGLLAAMAIPAFTKVRTTSQNKAISNNIRQIQSAADQYFLEKGATQVALSNLFGTDNYIKGSTDTLAVASETYPATLTQGNNHTINSVPTGAGGNTTDDHKPTDNSTTFVFSL